MDSHCDAWGERKVLNLDAVTEPRPLIDALEMFFETADLLRWRSDDSVPLGVAYDRTSASAVLMASRPSTTTTS
ncbi:MAG: hypothetical protein ACRD2C_19160 [Acidimicrobiales bacterium]